VNLNQPVDYCGKKPSQTAGEAPLVTGGVPPSSNNHQGNIMPTIADKPYEPISFAKKHRISVEDARDILDQAGGDKKAADKHARRVSV
jgi:hypothetical protein